MDITLPPDFKEFLNLLNTHGVEYLLIGGYAVGYHGYPRVTAIIDGVDVNLISLPFLRVNKQASGRHKDLDDLENLP